MPARLDPACRRQAQGTRSPDPHAGVGERAKRHRPPQIRGPVCDVSSSARHPVCPRPHRFWAAGRTAQLLLIAVSGGIEDYFHEISTASALANSRVTPGHPRARRGLRRRGGHLASALTSGRHHRHRSRHERLPWGGQAVAVGSRLTGSARAHRHRCSRRTGCGSAGDRPQPAGAVLAVGGLAGMLHLWVVMRVVTGALRLICLRLSNGIAKGIFLRIFGWCGTMRNR
jgi:hypothetical protein